MNFALKLAAALTLFIPLCSASSAENKAGWLVGFYQDTFTKKQVSAAFTQQSDTQFGGDTLGLMCVEGSPRLTFKPNGLYFAETKAVMFRVSDETIEVTFTPKKVEAFGTQLIAIDDNEITNQIATLSGADIAYKYDDNQGVFSNIGINDIMAIMGKACNS